MNPSLRFICVVLALLGLATPSLLAQTRRSKPKVSLRDKGDLTRSVRQWLKARQEVIVPDQKCEGDGYVNKQRVGRRGYTSRPLLHKACHGTGCLLNSKALDDLNDTYLPKASLPLPGLSGARLLRRQVKAMLRTVRPVPVLKDRLQARLGLISGPAKIKKVKTRFEEPSKGFLVASITTNVEPRRTRWVKQGRKWFVVNSKDEARLLREHENEMSPAPREKVAGGGRPREAGGACG